MFLPLSKCKKYPLLIVLNLTQSSLHTETLFSTTFLCQNSPLEGLLKNMCFRCNLVFLVLLWN